MDDPRQDYYVYLLRDPRDGSPIYCGKGTGNRLRQHWTSAMSGKHYNPYLQNKLLKISSEGFEAPIDEKLIEDVTEGIALAMEVSFISAIGRNSLCNLTSGGEGISGLDEKTMRKNVESLRKTLQTPEARQKKRDVAARLLSDFEYRREHNDIMQKVNQDPDRNKRIGSSFKKLWQDPKYRSKVLKSRMGVKRSNNTSGYCGVTLEGRRWLARIKIDGRETRLGTFATREEAAFAYNRKAIELYGPDARLNVIPSAASTSWEFPGWEAAA